MRVGSTKQVSCTSYLVKADQNTHAEPLQCAEVAIGRKVANLRVARLLCVLFFTLFDTSKLQQ